MARHLTALSVLLVCCISFVAARESRPVRVSESVMQGMVLNRVDPVAPDGGVEGTVVLNVFIDKLGAVKTLEAVSGPPTLVPAALDAVKQWKYRPYLLNGAPVAVATTIHLEFKSSRKPESNGVVGDAPGGLPTEAPGGSGPAVAAPAPQTAVPQRVRVSAGVSQSLLVDKVAPQYPPDARDQHIQGTVLLKVKIDKQGSVYNVELISGHPQLAPSAIEAVKQWKYKPYLLNGNPVEVETQVQVNFVLAEP